MKKKFTGLHLRVCSLSLFFSSPPSTWSWTWTSAKRECRRFNQSKFPISQCHSVIHWVGCMFKEKIPLSLKCLFCLHALIYISHCSAAEECSGWQISDTHRSLFHVFRRKKETYTHPHARAHRISQLSAPAKASKSILTLTAQSCCTPKKNDKHCFVLSPSHLQNVWSTFTHTNCPESTICPCHFCHFFLLESNWLNSQPQSKSSTASKVVRGHLEALIMTHSSHRVLQHYNVVTAAEDVSS